jgi:hypothetical protein
MTAEGRITTARLTKGIRLVTAENGHAIDRKRGTVREVAEVTAQMITGRRSRRVYTITFTDGVSTTAAPATTWTLAKDQGPTTQEGTTMSTTENTAPAESAEAKAERHQALAIRKADQAAQEAAEAKVTKQVKKAAKKAAPAKSTVTVKNGKAAFPVAPSVPEALRERVGQEAPGLVGYFVRYPYASYDLALRVTGSELGPKWYAVCRHGNHSEGTDKLMGEGGVEKQAAARKSWCSDCAAPAAKAAPAKKAETKTAKAAPAKAARKPRTAKTSAKAAESK